MSPINFDDRLWKVYRTGRALTEQARDVWMTVLEAYVGASRPLTLLDLGAGTGRFSPILADHFGGPVYAIEPAARMRQVAKRSNNHPRVKYVGGRAESIPLREASCDAAFLFLSYHHFVDRRKAAAELARVVRKGGIVFIRTEFSNRHHDVVWHKYFGPAAQADISMYPSFDETVRTLRRAGIDQLAVERVRYMAAKSMRDYVDRLRLRPLSALQQVNEEEMERALQALHEEALRDDGPVYEVGHALVCRRI